MTFLLQYLKKQINCNQIFPKINLNKCIVAKARRRKEFVKEFLEELGIFKLAKPDDIHSRAFEKFAKAILEKYGQGRSQGVEMDDLGDDRPQLTE